MCDQRIGLNCDKRMESVKRGRVTFFEGRGIRNIKSLFGIILCDGEY